MSGLFIGHGDGVASNRFEIDADSLTTHACCFGMTGSGKTGLCCVFLEEVAVAGVPAIIIDPKGDLANLALRQERYTAETLEPWVDGGEADRRGVSRGQLAQEEADKYEGGLTRSGVDADRRRAWNQGVDVRVFTPGDLGSPIDVLGALGRAPANRADAHGEVQGAVGALMGLVEHGGDPVSDPAHVLLAQLLTHAWSKGESLDLPGIITGLVDPPFAKVGVFAVEDFFPRPGRLQLARKLNAVLASPGFAAWREGPQLDIEALLRRDLDRTPLTIFSIPHLGAAQRMFFVTQLLSRLVVWTRRQPGTSALRAVLYLDEAMGFAPPHPANPPTKTPLLQLMKQARAVGLGVVLATQNPVDVDYKATANAGTWWVGQLRTEQDQDRLLGGLTAGGLDKASVRDKVASLPRWTFVQRAAKSTDLSTFRTRWAMSFLRGPMTLAELSRLRPSKAPTPDPPAEEAPVSAVPVASPTPPPAPGPVEVVPPGYTAGPPLAPKGYSYAFLSPEVAFSARLAPITSRRAVGPRADGQILWEPAVYVALRLRFDEGRDFVENRDEHRLFFPIDEEHTSLGEPGFERGDLGGDVPKGLFAPLPDDLDEARELASFRKGVVDEVLRGETTTMWRHRGLRLKSRAGEGEEAFGARVEQGIQDRIDAEVGKLKDRVDREVERLETRRKKYERDLAKREMEANAAMTTEVVSAGETLFGLFFGTRKKSLTTAVTRRKQTLQAKERITRLEQEITDLERAVFDLEEETRLKIHNIEMKHRAVGEDVEAIEVGLERNDIGVDEFTVVWIPVTRPI